MENAKCQVDLGKVLLGILQALTSTIPASIGPSYFSPIMALFTKEVGAFLRILSMQKQQLQTIVSLAKVERWFFRAFRPTKMIFKTRIT